MIADAPASRRWFRFAYSLRTLFLVVTALCIWLGWNANIVQQRKRMREQERLDRQNHVLAHFTFSNQFAAPPVLPPKANRTTQMEWRYQIQRIEYDKHVNLKRALSDPLVSKDLSRLRRWLGDEPVDLITVYNQTDHDLARSLFSEAYIDIRFPRREWKPDLKPGD